MRNKLLFIIISFFIVNVGTAQLVEVRYEYSSIGDCIFSAHNNAPFPIFLNVDFADLQNTSFDEELPYIKKLDPGFNSLFTLQRDLDAEVPRFNYQVKSFRSNPTAIVNLDFPYLIPFEPGKKVHAKEVTEIDGFWGAGKLKSWIAFGFVAHPGDKVYAARQGMVVEVAEQEKGGEPQFWYNTWNYAITVLQPDGTLICYRNVSTKVVKMNQKIYAGQLLGEIAPDATELKILIYQNSFNSKDLRFIIPEFCIGENETEILNVAKEYTVIHPVSVRRLEMTKKERRKILGKSGR
jgi:hypothetical protein